MFCRLSRNKIGDAGATAIANAIAVNASVTKLYLYDNKIGDEGAKALASALEVNAFVTELSLGFNKIGDQGATAIANAIAVNASNPMDGKRGARGRRRAQLRLGGVADGIVPEPQAGHRGVDRDRV